MLEYLLIGRILNVFKRRNREVRSPNWFVGQPKGLFTLFFTEFWYVFHIMVCVPFYVSNMYYAVKDGGLGLDRTKANIIMSIYGSLIYMSGIIGGWIADCITGMRKAIFYGGILIMIGHILLALPLGVTALYLSMFFIIIGTGLLKTKRFIGSW